MSEKYDFFWTTMELCDWKKLTRRCVMIHFYIPDVLL